ncbi:MAG: C40 family peptidase [Gemmatimonadota bacterium]|nr:C40 family peptidase [Gemmatimonadota bacterium]
MSRLQERIEALRAEHLPDARLGVWDVAVEEADGASRVVGAVSEVGAVEPLLEAAEGAGATFDVRILPDSSLGPLRATAHRSLAHLRREPRHAAELVSQMILGEEALVLDADGEWLRVQTGDRYVAWVHRSSVVRARARDRDTFRRRLFRRDPPADTWVVTARGIVMRASPEPHAPVVCDLVEGARVAVEVPDADSLERRAARIRLPDGTTGWVPAGAVLPADRLAERFSPEGRAILDHAAQFLGLPYLWGGTSEKGFDCSGLVQRVYGLHGRWLPRDSDQQAVEGEPVDPGDRWEHVRAGDLAFFSETPGKITHVGILAEGGRLLHASTTRHGVAWDALGPTASDRTEFGERLAEMLVGVRRVLAA